MTEHKQSIPGLAMACAGMALLLINAVSYLAGWEFGHPGLVVIGIVLAVTGARMMRSARGGSA